MRVWILVIAMVTGPWVSLAAQADDVCYDYTEVNVPDDAGDDLFTSWFGLNDRNQAVGNFCIDPSCNAVGPDLQIVGGAIYTIPALGDDDDDDEDDDDDDDGDDDDGDDDDDESSPGVGDGTFETFTLPSPYNWVGSLDINNWGVVAGNALEGEVTGTVFSGFLSGAAFVRYPSGRLVVLPPPVPGATFYAAVSINDWGQIVGFFEDPAAGDRRRGFIYTWGRYRVFDAGPGQTEINGINNRGDIVGTYIDPSGELRAFYQERGARRWRRGPVEIISVPDSDRNILSGINRGGTAVGAYRPTGTPVPVFRESYIYDDGDIISPLVFPGAVSTRAGDINNHGIIAGTFDVFSYGFIAVPMECEDD